MTNCPLCQSLQIRYLDRDKRREYHYCCHCTLIFVPSVYHVTPQQEKQCYNHHNNSPDDEGYCRFLNQLCEPLTHYLTSGMRGLDVGSGPGPTLNQLLDNAGFPTQIYDPFYANHTSLLKHQYDFVTATEVVEHFNTPGHSWQQLASLVKPGGFLGIMTLLYDESVFNKFVQWWYNNDKTHIAFYSLETLHWIARHFQLTLKHHTKRVAIFQKQCD